MVEKMFFVLAAIILLAIPANAMMCGSDMGGTDHNEQSMTTANEQKCPVSGEAVPKNSNATYEYMGKVYKFCCPGCIDEFKSNPGKYTDHSTHQHNG